MIYASLLLPENEAAKLKQISLSNNTIGRRINEMSTDILDQIILKIECSEIFAIQLDESTNVSDLTQLMVFERYIHTDTLEDEFLFCEPLEKTTKAIAIFKKVDDFFERHGKIVVMFALMVHQQ